MSKATFKLYRVSSSELLIHSESELKSKFSICRENYNYDIDHKELNLGTSDGSSLIDILTSLERYAQLYSKSHLLIDSFEESDATVMDRARNLVRVIDRDIRNMKMNNDDNSKMSWYCCGFIHTIIVGLILGRDIVVGIDVLENLMEIVIMIDHDSNDEIDDESERKPSVNDIGYYCVIRDIVNLPSLREDRKMNSTLTFYRDPDESQNSYEKLLSRAIEAKALLQCQNRLSKSLKIKLTSLIDIFRNLSSNGEMEVIQYDVVKDDNGYSHLVKGPLVTTLISIVDSNGFNGDKQPELRCFPLTNSLSFGPMIRLFGNDVGNLRAKIHPLNSNILADDKIQKLKSVISLFNIIDSYSNPFLNRYGNMNRFNIDEYELIDCLKFIDLYDIRNNINDSIGPDVIEQVVDMVRVMGMNNFKRLPFELMVHMVPNPNPYSDSLRTKTREFSNSRNRYEIEPIYILDLNSWSTHCNRIERVMKTLSIDRTTFAMLVEMIKPSRVDMLGYILSTLNPRIIVEMISASYLESSPDEYYHLVTTSLIEISSYTENIGSCNTRELSQIVRNRMNIGAKNESAKCADDDVIGDLRCIVDNQSICINCTRYTKSVKNDKSKYPFNDHRVVITDATFIMFGLQLFDAIRIDRETDIQSVTTNILTRLNNTLRQSLIEYFQNSTDASTNTHRDASKERQIDNEQISISDISDSDEPIFDFEPGDIIVDKKRSRESESDRESESSIEFDNWADYPDIYEIERLWRIKMVWKRLQIIESALDLVSFESADPVLMKNLDANLMIRNMVYALNNDSPNIKQKRFAVLNQAIADLHSSSPKSGLTDVLSRLEYRDCGLQVISSEQNKNRRDSPITYQTIDKFRSIIKLIETTSKLFNKTGHVDREIKTNILNMFTTNVELIRLLDLNGELGEVIYRTYNPDVIVGYLNRTDHTMKRVGDLIVRLEQDITSERLYYTPEDINELMRIVKTLFASYGGCIVESSRGDGLAAVIDGKIHLDSRIYQILLRTKTDSNVSETRYDTS